VSVGGDATAWNLLDRLVYGGKPSCCLLGLWHCTEMILQVVYDGAGVFTYSIEADLVDAFESGQSAAPVEAEL
jgi:hypothetical protein